jgi:glucose/arabinose dehydrogenase
VNVIRPGANYGWPVITYGVQYVIGTQIGEGTHKPGMEQPVWKWVPSIAPSGMAFYSGDKFPKWRGDLFVGALKAQLLVRLELDGEKVVREERLLQGLLGRIRDVRSGPDGFIYLLTDAANGVLARLEPAP